MSASTAFRLAVERMRDGTPSDVVVEVMELAVGNLAGDELDVLGEVMERLKLGRDEYGQWVAAKERRDLRREALDEELDDVVYRAMRTVMRSRETPVRKPVALRMVGGRDE